jgi:hypothetical protein
MKKFIIGSVLGVAIILGSLYIVLKEHQQPVDSAFKAVPLDALVIIDIKEYNSFRNNLDKNNQLWKSISDINFFQTLEKKMHGFDSLKTKYNEIEKLIQNQPQILISLHVIGRESFIPIYYLKIPEASNFRRLCKVVDNIQGADVTERSYDGETIRDIILPSNQGAFSFAYKNGVLAVSTSSLLIENVIRQLGAQVSIDQKKGIGELIKSAGKSHSVNIYFNLQSIPQFFSDILQVRYKDVLHFIGRSGGWTELDLNINNELLVFNGFTVPGDDSLGLSSIFSGQQPQKLEVLSIVPTDAIAVMALGISNFDTYSLNHQRYLEEVGLWEPFSTSLDSVSKVLGDNFTSDFKTIFDKECALIITPGAMDSLNSCSFSVIKIKNQEDTHKLLSDWVDITSDSLKIKPESLKSEMSTDKNNKFIIYQFPFGNIPAALFGQFFNIALNKYCMVYENFLIFGNSVQALNDYILYISTNNTLTTDIEFNSFSDNFSSESNGFFYMKPSVPINFYSNFLKTKIVDEIAKKYASLNNLSTFLYQFNVNNKNLIYNNVLLKMISKADVPKTKTIWESKLEGKVQIKPLIIRNKKTGETDILVQDSKNILYLLNSNGRIIWRLYLDEPLLSEVFPIDYFKNRKIQYLFNTKSKIYLVDRLGKIVENYPIDLKEHATNGIAVFDYSNNRKYRIFYASENRKIILLDKEGRAEDEWNFKKTRGIVKNPLQHIRYDNSDYLVFNDDKQVYILNRKGGERIKIKKDITISKNNSLHFVPGVRKQKASFYATDSTGLIYSINLKGEVSELDVGRFPANHFFEVCDLNADRITDFIFTSGNQIQVFSREKTVQFLIKAEQPILNRPVLFEKESGKFKIGYVLPSKEKIYLHELNGTLYKGFPLKGNTQFSVILLNNSENRFNLIVGTNNNFLYNYTVQ